MHLIVRKLSCSQTSRRWWKHPPLPLCYAGG